MPLRQENRQFKPPRHELLRLRREHHKLHGDRAETFAEKLGVSRMHMTSVERGRRDPSLELAVRWLELLGPEATPDLFEPCPALDLCKALQRRFKAQPENTEAA